jgi:hypothetical protein
MYCTVCHEPIGLTETVVFMFGQTLHGRCFENLAPRPLDAGAARGATGPVEATRIREADRA